MSTLDDLERLAKAATPGPRRAAVNADAWVYRGDGSRIDFGDALYHPGNAADAHLAAALDPTTVLDLIAKARLGEAWARAEAALPRSGWRMHSLTSEGSYWLAVAGRKDPRWEGRNSEAATGPTPEAALHALAEKLEQGHE